VGPYRDTVSSGLRWLLQQQGLTGNLARQASGNAAMYAHGQGAIVLCEAFSMTATNNSESRLRKRSTTLSTLSMRMADGDTAQARPEIRACWVGN
jgi:hypothetical protein